MSRRHVTAPAALGLFATTVGAFFLQVVAGGDVVARALGLIPIRVANLATIATRAPGQAVPAWFTLITYMFLHAGWWHVATNMPALGLFGSRAEPLMGSGRFLRIYILSGVLTGVLIVGLSPETMTPAVGASGAICGVVGAFLAMGLRDRSPAVVAAETASLVAAGLWLVRRTPTPVPDRMCALMWHVIPFQAGWAYARLGGLRLGAGNRGPADATGTRQGEDATMSASPPIAMTLPERSPVNLRIRDATEADLPAIVEIYNQSIPGGWSTADTRPIAVSDRVEWFRKFDPARRPIWVVEDQNAVVAVAYLSSFYGGRPAYDATAEISVYIAASHQRRGIGRWLKEWVIAQCPRLGVTTLLSMHFDHNEATPRINESLGFELQGHLTEIAVVQGQTRGLKIWALRIAPE